MLDYCLFHNRNRIFAPYEESLSPFGQILIGVFFVDFILVSCSKLSLKGIFSEVDEEEAIIKDARASFEVECARLSSIMTKGATSKNEFRFQLGTIVPDWESTGYSITKDGAKESLDVRVPEYTYSYRSYSLEDGADSSSFVKWYHKLVYVHDIETDESNCYVVFYIPT